MKKLTLLFFVLLASVASAGEPVVCTLTTATGAATSTASCTTGSATWGKGQLVLMQCTTDTYVSHTTPAGSTTVTAATSSMELVDFTNNKDKVELPLNNNDQHVSVLAATSAGTCKFFVTTRRHPGRAQ